MWPRRLERRVARIEGGSTAPANLEVHVEILVKIARGLLPGRWLCRLALLDGPSVLILFKLLGHLGLILFDKGGKSDGSVIGDFHVRRGASNAHGRDRGVDLHIAGFGHLAGNERERSLG